MDKHKLQKPHSHRYKYNTSSSEQEFACILMVAVQIDTGYL